MSVYPLIMAGGAGTRLWPLSSPVKPKPFLTLKQDGKTLLQSTLERVQSVPSLLPPLVIANQRHQALLQEQLEQYPYSHLILEPQDCSTAAAIAVAALYLYTKDPQGILLCMPCDHWIESAEAWGQSVTQAIQFTEETEALVTVGVQANSSHTQYGLILAQEPVHPGSTIYKADKYIEKPNIKLAEELLRSSPFHWWNTGIVTVSLKTLINAYQEFAPQILLQAEAALSQGKHNEHLTFLDGSSYQAMPNLQFDYAIMENIDPLYVVPLKSEWTDLGTWFSLYNILPHDDVENAGFGKTAFYNCKNCLSYSEDISLTLIGMDNVVAVSRGKDVLIMPLQKDDLLKQFMPFIPQHPDEDFRPWGYFQRITAQKGFHVKRLEIKPNSRISLQKHTHRSEIWVVIEGTAEVTVEDKVLTLHPTQTIPIPRGSKHRIKNSGPNTLIIVEIQLGNIIEEDDIIRFEDDYGRL